jgi:hypothetical protein
LGGPCLTIAHAPGNTKCDGAKRGTCLRLASRGWCGLGDLVAVDARLGEKPHIHPWDPRDGMPSWVKKAEVEEGDHLGPPRVQWAEPGETKRRIRTRLQGTTIRQLTSSARLTQKPTRRHRIGGDGIPESR